MMAEYQVSGFYSLTAQIPSFAIVLYGKESSPFKYAAEISEAGIIIEFVRFASSSDIILPPAEMDAPCRSVGDRACYSLIGQDGVISLFQDLSDMRDHMEAVLPARTFKEAPFFEQSIAYQMQSKEIEGEAAIACLKSILKNSEKLGRVWAEFGTMSDYARSLVKNNLESYDGELVFKEPVIDSRTVVWVSRDLSEITSVATYGLENLKFISPSDIQKLGLTPKYLFLSRRDLSYVLQDKVAKRRLDSAMAMGLVAFQVSPHSSGISAKRPVIFERNSKLGVSLMNVSTSEENHVDFLNSYLIDE